MPDGSQNSPAPSKTSAEPRCLIVCVNVHCSLNGSDDLVDHLATAHGILPGADNPHGVRLELTHCFAACDLGPNVDFDGTLYDGVTAEQLDRLIESAAR